SSDGVYMATGNESGQVLLWKKEGSGKGIAYRAVGFYVFVLPSKKSGKEVLSLVFSPDQHQRFLAVGGKQDSIMLLEVQQMEQGKSISPSVRLKSNIQNPNEQTVWALAFDKTSKYVASGSRDGYVRLWELPLS